MIVPLTADIVLHNTVIGGSICMTRTEINDEITFFGQVYPSGPVCHSHSKFACCNTGLIVSNIPKKPHYDKNYLSPCGITEVLDILVKKEAVARQ